MRERTRIKDDEIDAVGGGLLYPVNQFMFGVALVTEQFMTELCRDLTAVRLDVGEARRPIDFGLA
jgi:hypothetical protein